MWVVLMDMNLLKSTIIAISQLLFKDYKIQYRYGTDPETDVIWESVPDDFVIPSKETVRFWIINDKNGRKR